MTVKSKTPTDSGFEAQYQQGFQSDEKSLTPSWSRKKSVPSLLRWEGRYVTPSQVYEEAKAERSGPQAGGALPVISPQVSRVTVFQSVSKLGPSSPSWPPLFSQVTQAQKAALLSLPCRFIETTQYKAPKKVVPKGLNSAHKKTAISLSWNVAYFVQKFGIENIGFLTLTFSEHITCSREASRRFNSLASNVLKLRYAEYIRVLERQKSGRIHYHLLVALNADIKTGLDFDSLKKRDYKTANKALRLEWAYWHKTASQYGFGRTELLPIKSNGDALGQYVGKYIGKHIGQRTEEDKGVRLVSYSSGAKMSTCKFTSTEKFATEWRQKVYQFIHLTRAAYPHEPVIGFGSLRRIYGKKWGYNWRDFIMQLPPADLSVPF